MKKVAFIISDLFHQGAQYATALMVRGFVAKGYDVDVLLSQYHTDFLKQGETPYEIPEKTNVIMMAHHRARHNIGELRRYLQSGGSDYVICMCPLNARALRIAAIGLIKRPKLFFVEHGIAGVHDMVHVAPPKPFTKQWVFNKWFYPKYDGCLAVCKSCVDDCWRMYNWKPEKIHLVYNPVIDDVFWRKVASPPSHLWLVNRECPTFITAGAHHPLKNHLFLMQVFKKLNEKARARLVVYGVGGMTDQYRAFVKKNHLEDVISIAGYCNNLPAEMKACDAYLCASLTESFSLVLVEALAAGTNVISCDCDYGPREVLENGKYGVLVPLNDETAMVKALQEQIARGRYKVDEESWRRFTIEKAVGRYERAMGISEGVDTRIA